eukprot:3923221-Pyramimonas_sp.AAC.1
MEATPLAATRAELHSGGPPGADVQRKVQGARAAPPTVCRNGRYRLPAPAVHGARPPHFGPCGHHR